MKRKTTKGSTDIKGILDQNSTTKHAMINTLNRLSATLKPDNNKASVGELYLKNRAFDHAKSMDSKKFELEEQRMTFERQRWKEKTAERKKDARVKLLQCDYKKALLNARNENDSDLKEMCIQVAKDSYKRYTDFLKAEAFEEEV